MIARVESKLAALFLMAISPALGAYPQDPTSLAKTVVTDMASGHFSRIESNSDQLMAREYPPGRLSRLWDNVLSQSGAFQAIIATDTKDVEGYHWVFVTCEFEKATWDFEIAFDSANRLAGLLAKPARQWSPPYYVNPSAFHDRQVTVASGRWKLPGTLSVPNGSGPFPAVVLVQGAGARDEDMTIGPNKPFKDIAWGLASRGIAALRYVKRTVQYVKEVDERRPGFTVNDEIVDDAGAAVALVAGQSETDPRRIVVLGHALGGMVAPRIAERDMRVAGIIIMSGNATPLEQSVIRQIRYLAKVEADIVDGAEYQVEDAERTAQEIESPSLNSSAIVKLLGASTPGSYWLDLRDYHPAQLAAQLNIPVLVLQAGRDYQVTREDFDEWKKALAGDPKASSKLYPGLFHLFLPSLAPGTGLGLPSDYETSSHVPEIVVTDLAHWISESLPPARH